MYGILTLDCVAVAYYDEQIYVASSPYHKLPEPTRDFLKILYLGDRMCYHHKIFRKSKPLYTPLYTLNLVLISDFYKDVWVQ